MVEIGSTEETNMRASLMTLFYTAALIGIVWFGVVNVADVYGWQQALGAFGVAILGVALVYLIGGYIVEQLGKKGERCPYCDRWHMRRENTEGYVMTKIFCTDCNVWYDASQSTEAKSVSRRS